MRQGLREGREGDKEGGRAPGEGGGGIAGEPLGGREAGRRHLKKWSGTARSSRASLGALRSASATRTA